MNLTEADIIFLKKLAISAYNSQFNTDHDSNDFEWKLLKSEDGNVLSYQLTHSTIATLRLRLMLTIEDRNVIGQYQLCVDSDKLVVGALGDEIMVASGVVERYIVE